MLEVYLDEGVVSQAGCCGLGSGSVYVWSGQCIVYCHFVYWPLTSVLIGDPQKRDKGRGHVKREAETGAMWPHVQLTWSPSRPREAPSLAPQVCRAQLTP